MGKQYGVMETDLLWTASTSPSQILPLPFVLRGRLGQVPFPFRASVSLPVRDSKIPYLTRLLRNVSKTDIEMSNSALHLTGIKHGQL